MWVNTAFASQAHLGKKCIPDLDCEIGWNWIQTQLGFGMCLVPASLANVKSVGFFLRVCFSLQLPPPCLLAGGQYWLQGARILQEEISRWSNIHRLFQSNQVDAVLFYDAELQKISMLVAKPQRTKMEEALETSLWHTLTKILLWKNVFVAVLNLNTPTNEWQSRNI